MERWVGIFCDTSVAVTLSHLKQPTWVQHRHTGATRLHLRLAHLGRVPQPMETDDGRARYRQASSVRKLQCSSRMRYRNGSSSRGGFRGGRAAVAATGLKSVRPGT